MKEILNENTKDYAYECFNEAVKMGLEFKTNKKFKQRKYHNTSNNELMTFPKEGIELKKLLHEFEEMVLPYCSNFNSVNFMGFPDAGNSIAGISGALLSDFLQQNLINSSFCAPIATYMEIAVISWLRELIGYKIKKINSIWDVGGVITYGGTGSNATAMLLARENYKNNTMKNGVEDASNYKTIIPKGIGHYSIRSSSMWLGCGDNIIEVETENYRYNISKLKEALIENKGKIMCVVSYAGDSRTMTIENLKEVYDTVKSVDKNIWLHVDACHGFSLCFSEKLKNKLNGIELFDSISTDPHKVLNIPYCVSALLIKNPEKFKLISSSSDLIMQEDFAWGQITPFIGSKSWVSLKIWFMMKNLGVEKIGQIVEERCVIAQKLGEKIKKNNNFALINDININSVVFMYIGNINKENVNEINAKSKKIYQKLLDDGEYYLHNFTIPDDKGIIKKGAILSPLRFMSGNPNIEEGDLDKMLEYIEKIAKEV